VLYNQGVTKGVVTPYISYTRNTFSLINPLTAFSQVFKPKPYLIAGGNYISLTGSLYSTSSKPKGKSYEFFQKVYSDKSANNPFFIVNNFFKLYPNKDLAKANLDYKLINTILCNHHPYITNQFSYEDLFIFICKVNLIKCYISKKMLLKEQ